VKREPEVVIEITLTWQHLLALVVAASLAIVWRFLLKLAAMGLLVIPLAGVKLGARCFSPRSKCGFSLRAVRWCTLGGAYLHRGSLRYPSTSKSPKRWSKSSWGRACA